MRIELHPEADGEFAAQVQYYDEREPGLGQRFYREVITSLSARAASPKSSGDLSGLEEALLRK